jgi:hypothetical protein
MPEYGKRIHDARKAASSSEIYDWREKQREKDLKKYLKQGGQNGTKGQDAEKGQDGKGFQGAKLKDLIKSLKQNVKDKTTTLTGNSGQRTGYSRLKSSKEEGKPVTKAAISSAASISAANATKNLQESE